MNKSMSLITALDPSDVCPISWLPYEVLSYILSQIGPAPSIVTVCRDFRAVAMNLPEWDMASYFKSLVMANHTELLLWYFINAYRMDGPTLQYLAINTEGMEAREPSELLPILLGVVSGGTVEEFRERLATNPEELKWERPVALALAKRGHIGMFEVFLDAIRRPGRKRCSVGSELLAVAALNGRYRMFQYLRGYERISSDVYKRNAGLHKYPWPSGILGCAVRSGSLRMIRRVLGYNKAGRNVYYPDKFNIKRSIGTLWTLYISDDPAPIVKPLTLKGLELLGTSERLVNAGLCRILAEMNALNCLEHIYRNGQMYAAVIDWVSVLYTITGYTLPFQWLYQTLLTDQRVLDNSVLMSQAAVVNVEVYRWLHSLGVPVLERHCRTYCTLEVLEYIYRELKVDLVPTALYMLNHYLPKHFQLCLDLGMVLTETLTIAVVRAGQLDVLESLLRVKTLDPTLRSYLPSYVVLMLTNDCPYPKITEWLK